MNQQQAREILPLYADGELDSPRAVELEAELEQSAELRDELERWRALRRCARRVMVAASVPAGLEAAIRSRISDRRSRTRGHPLRIFGGVTAIAAAIALLVIFWPADAAPAELRLVNAEDFARIYRGCARDRRHRGVDVDLTNLDRARQTLGSLTTFPVLVPDLSGQGFQLDGVCRCFHVGGVKAMHVFYRSAGATPAVVSFFSVDQRLNLAHCERCPSNCGARGEYQVGQSQDVLVFKWDEANSSFAVCSQMSETQLRDLVEGLPTVACRVWPAVYVRAD